MRFSGGGSSERAVRLAGTSAGESEGAQPTRSVDSQPPPPGVHMGRRRKAREVALQLLYQLDVQGESNPEPHLDEFWSRHPVDPDAREFGEALVRGTKLHEAKIDE